MGENKLKEKGSLNHFSNKFRTYRFRLLLTDESLLIPGDRLVIDVTLDPDEALRY